MKSMNNNIRRATFIELLFGSLLGISVNLFTNFGNYFSYYLTGIVGVGIILASSFITLFRIWDAVTDLGMGVIVDKTNTRFGKFRPYLVIGTIGCVISSWALVNVPILFPENPSIRFTVYIVLYMLFVICTTMQASAVRSTAQVLTDDHKQRATIGVIRGISLTLMYAAIPILVYSHIIPQTKGFNLDFFQTLWKYVIVFNVLFAVLTLFAYRKYDVYQPDAIKKEKPKLTFKIIKDLLTHNRPLQMLILSAGTDKLATVCQNNATIVVIIYAIVAGNSKLSSGAASYTIIPSIILILIGLGAIGRKFGAKKSMIISSIGGIVVCTAQILLWIFGDPTTLSFPGFEGFNGWTFFTIVFLVLWCLMKGLGMVSANVVNPLVADVIDYETYRSGNYCPGTIGSLFNLADKIISSLGPTIVGVLCAMIGFKDDLPTIDTPYSISLFAIGLVGMYGMVILGLIVNLVAMKFYDLTPEKMEMIQEELKKRKVQEEIL